MRKIMKGGGRWFSPPSCARLLDALNSKCSTIVVHNSDVNISIFLENNMNGFEEVEDVSFSQYLVHYLDMTEQLVSLSQSIQTFSTYISEHSDNTSLNDTISSACSVSAGNTKPFRQVFYFHLGELCNLSPELARFVESAPEEFIALLQDVVYEFTQYSGSEDIILKSQDCPILCLHALYIHILSQPDKKKSNVE